MLHARDQLDLLIQDLIALGMRVLSDAKDDHDQAHRAMQLEFVADQLEDVVQRLHSLRLHLRVEEDIGDDKS